MTITIQVALLAGSGSALLLLTQAPYSVSSAGILACVPWMLLAGFENGVRETMNAMVRPLLIACAAGVLLVLSQAPYSILPAGLLAPVPLVLLAELPCRCRIRYVAAYVGALVAFGLGCGWVRFTAPANLVMMMGPEGFTFPAVVALLRLGPTRGIRGALHLAVCWTAIEYLRSHWPFNGFPYLLLGHAAVRPLQMAQAADLVGVFGMTFLLAFVGGLILDAARPGPGRRLAAILAGALLIATYGYGAWRAPQVLEGTEEGPRVGLVQANISQELKVRQQPEVILRPHMEQSMAVVRAAKEDAAAGSIDLLVWPETMVPGWMLHDPERIPDEALARYVDDSREFERDLIDGWLVPQITQPLGCSALLGALTWNAVHPDAGGDTYNTALLFDPSGKRVGSYDKSVLVPGGEFVPMRDFLPKVMFDGIRRLAGFVPNLTRGSGPKVLEIGGPAGEAGAGVGRRFAPTICYENCYPGYNARAVNAGADFLLNISNEAWFRDSIQMDQMQVASRFRAIETRRTLVRSTNSGISAIYDAAGRRVSILEDAEGRDREFPGVLIRDVPITLRGSLYRRVGDLIAVGAMIVALLRGLGALRRRYLLRRST